MVLPYFPLLCIWTLSNKSMNFQKNIIYIPFLNIDGLDGAFKKKAHGETGENIDLNRSFYAYDELDQYTSNPENELVIELIKSINQNIGLFPIAH